MSKTPRTGRLYISGPMTGYPDFNKPAFAAAAEKWAALGWDVVNPHESDTAECVTHADYMRKDIPLLLDVEAIVLIDGWEDSKGARFELHMAQILGLEVYYDVIQSVSLETHRLWIARRGAAEETPLDAAPVAATEGEEAEDDELAARLLEQQKAQEKADRARYDESLEITAGGA